MKKILTLLAAVVMLASCSISKTASSTDYVGTGIQAFKAASLNVDDQLLRYTYVPSWLNGRILSDSQLVQNAIYEALNGKSYDTMVEVRYSLETRFGLFGRHVARVDISGFPAKYTDFRDPTDEDRKNAEAFNKNVVILK